MSLISFLPPHAGENRDEPCPFLGLRQDQETSLAYPSSWNVCHHTKPIGTPRLEFQQSYCFTKEHATCPIFTRSKRGPIPPAISFPVSKPPVIKRVILPILIGGIVVLLAVLGVLRLVQDRNKQNGGLSVTPGSATPSASMSASPTATFPPTDTPVLPTLTPTPVRTTTSTLAPAGPATRPTDTLWPTQTPTRTPTATPSTPTPLPSATLKFVPTWTVRPTDTLWPWRAPTNAP